MSENCEEELARAEQTAADLFAVIAEIAEIVGLSGNEPDVCEKVVRKVRSIKTVFDGAHLVIETKDAANDILAGQLQRALDLLEPLAQLNKDTEAFYRQHYETLRPNSKMTSVNVSYGDLRRAAKLLEEVG